MDASAGTARVWLIRHAQASFGSDDYDRLSKLGHAQADWLGAYLAGHDLRFDALTHGALRRHRETAERLLPLAPPPSTDPRWDELDFEALQGAFTAATGRTVPMSRTGILDLFPDIYALWAEDGLGPDIEPFAAFEARVAAALDAARQPGRTVLVVTSGGVIGMALAQVLGLGPRSAADLMLAAFNASIHRIEHEAGRWRLAEFNATPHLEAPGRTRTHI